MKQNHVINGFLYSRGLSYHDLGQEIEDYLLTVLRAGKSSKFLTPLMLEPLVNKPGKFQRCSG